MNGTDDEPGLNYQCSAVNGADDEPVAVLGQILRIDSSLTRTVAFKVM